MREIAIGLLWVFLVVVVSAGNRLKTVETECRAELGEWNDRCQTACEFEKLGFTENGKFRIGRVLKMIEKDGTVRLYPDNKKILLKLGLLGCYRRIGPDGSPDPCSSAAAMRYCLDSILQPAELYWKEDPAPDEKSTGIVCSRFKCGRMQGNRIE